MKKRTLLIISLILYLMCILFSTKVRAQNIGINSTGATANLSAILDVQSSSKGLLIPRVTSAQKTAMNPLPAAAQGLVIYQTDGVQGFYYNTSTTTTPVWNYLAPSGASAGWLLTGNTGTTAGTNFIGTTDPVDLVFKTSAIELMRIVAGPKSLCIGATFPTAYSRLYVETDAHQYVGYFKNAGTGNSSTYGLYADNQSISAGTVTGIMSSVTADATNNAYGTDVFVSGNTPNRYGSRIIIQGASGSLSRGLQIDDNTNTSDKMGISANLQGYGNTATGIDVNEASLSNTKIGIHALTSGNSMGNAYGIVVDENADMGNKYGIKATLTGTATTDSYGINVNNQSITNQNKYGIASTVTGNSTNSFGYILNDNATANQNKYGLQANINGSAFQNSTGIEVNQNSNTNAVKTGISVNTSGFSNNTVYGINIAEAAPANTKYGINAEMSGNTNTSYCANFVNNTNSSFVSYGIKVDNIAGGGGVHYGIYSKCNFPSTNDWAGYFVGRGYFSDKVGINTTNPTEMLEVNGKVRIGSYTLPSVDGGFGQVLQTNGSGTVSWASMGSGTVTSVALSMPSIFSVSGSPVTTSGILDADFNNQPANQVFAGPASGAPNVPDFRALVSADIPDLSGNYIKNQTVTTNFTTGQTANFDVTGNAEIGGTLNVSGNTGIGTLTPGAKLEVAGQVKITGGIPGAGKVLTSDAAGLASWQTPSGGNNWTLTGNSGTTAGTNFIGTTDNADFVLKRNNDEGIRLTAGGAVWATGNSATGVTPASGAGKRMMWIPAKSAFRAGEVTGTQWDDANIGNKSIALSIDSKASGYASIAIGESSWATGGNSLAIGWQNMASGIMTSAVGRSNTASGAGASAFGQNNTVSGNYAATIGIGNLVTGDSAMALGKNVMATGQSSTAIGTNVTTNAFKGACIIGDNSINGLTQASAQNQMMMRFDGGYVFYTDAATTAAKSVVFNAGNVGVGTAAPGAKLEVAGQVKITGGTPGAGKVLTSDAVGLASWQTLSGGSNWTLTGNSGTTAGTNFIGTTDNADFVLKRNNDEGLRLTAGGTLWASGNTTTGVTPTSGAGTRMMWIPAKAAFRVGQVIGTEWDNANIGMQSTAFGFRNIASGQASVATGIATTASGPQALSCGIFTTASGANAAAFGNGTVASGINSIALGYNCSALNNSCFAMGSNSYASGYNSLAYGTSTVASGNYSTAIGNQSQSGGDSSIVIGNNISTTAHGEFVAGDASGNFLIGNTANQMAMRFSGGYVFYTDALLTPAKSVVFNNGNVGIGTVSPANKLDVLGSIRTGGQGTDGQLQLYSEQGATDFTYTINPNAAATQNVTLTLPPNDGNANDVLITDGSGNLSWVAPAGGSTNWTLTGNAATNDPAVPATYGTSTIAAGENYIGTTDAQDVVMATNTIERLRIKQTTGNIGIGTSAPSERLHVTQTSDANKNVIFAFSNQTSGSADYQNTAVTGLGQGNGTASGFGYGFGVKGIGSTNGWGAVGVYAGLGTTVPAVILNNNYYALYADAGTTAANKYAATFLNGNVGVGTSAPAASLDVNGTAKVGTLGTVLTNIIKSTNTVDVASVPANSSLAVSYAITNVAVGSTVAVSPATALTNGLVIAYARVSAANTVEVKFTNVTAGAIDPPSMDYYITVIR